jgi:hypothetical protein
VQASPLAPLLAKDHREASGGAEYKRVSSSCDVILAAAAVVHSWLQEGQVAVPFMPVINLHEIVSLDTLSEYEDWWRSGKEGDFEARRGRNKGSQRLLKRFEGKVLKLPLGLIFGGVAPYLSGSRVAIEVDVDQMLGACIHSLNETCVYCCPLTASDYAALAHA